MVILLQLFTALPVIIRLLHILISTLPLLTFHFAALILWLIDSPTLRTNLQLSASSLENDLSRYGTGRYHEYEGTVLDDILRNSPSSLPADVHQELVFGTLEDMLDDFGENASDSHRALIDREQTFNGAVNVLQTYAYHHLHTDAAGFQDAKILWLADWNRDNVSKDDLWLLMI